MNIIQTIQTCCQHAENCEKCIFRDDKKQEFGCSFQLPPIDWDVEKIETALEKLEAKFKKDNSIVNPQEFFMKWEEVNNPFYPDEMKYRRSTINEMLLAYMKQFKTTTEVMNKITEET